MLKVFKCVFVSVHLLFFHCNSFTYQVPWEFRTTDSPVKRIDGEDICTKEHTLTPLAKGKVKLTKTIFTFTK